MVTRQATFPFYYVGRQCLEPPAYQLEAFGSHKKHSLVDVLIQPATALQA